MSVDMVNHPPHYGGGDNPYEAVRVIEAWELGFNLGNAVKYVKRAGKKNDAMEDLKKAAWYLNREIANREKANRPQGLAVTGNGVQNPPVGVLAPAKSPSPDVADCPSCGFTPSVVEELSPCVGWRVVCTKCWRMILLGADRATAVSCWNESAALAKEAAAKHRGPMTLALAAKPASPDVPPVDCPCGFPPSVAIHKTNTGKWFVACTKCSRSAEVRETMAEAVAAWNSVMA